MFRLKISYVEIILQEIGRRLIIYEEPLWGRPPLCTEKQVLRTLWSLGTQSMVHTTEDRIDITALSVIRARRNIVDAIISVIPKVIKWLNRSEVQTIILYFQITRGFPNVIWGSRRYSYQIYTSPKQSRAIYIYILPERDSILCTCKFTFHTCWCRMA